ncbi:hypothetical protein OAB85_00980 [Pseudomonadales bacterium]|nr:hypothetical protein [Pseudomonadales bacterium]
MAARALEEAGIPTVIMGCARDIVEHVGVPRFYFSDFPLGHSAGKPHDEDSQMQTLKDALKLLETATQPRTTVESNQVWSQDASWKNDFLNIERLSPMEVNALRENYKKQREAAAMLKNSAKD